MTRLHYELYACYENPYDLNVSQTQVLHPPEEIHVTTQTLYALVRTLFDPIACTRLPMSLPHPTTHELQKAAAATLHAPAWLKTNFGGARSRRDRPGD